MNRSSTVSIQLFRYANHLTNIILGRRIRYLWLIVYVELGRDLSTRMPENYHFPGVITLTAVRIRHGNNRDRKINGLDPRGLPVHNLFLCRKLQVLDLIRIKHSRRLPGPKKEYKNPNNSIPQTPRFINILRDQTEEKV